MSSTTSALPKRQETLARLANVQESIHRAAKRYQRPIDEIHLIAVSKTFGREAILPVLAQGQRLFGENRVQEAKSKWPALRAEFPDVELHLIGPLQSNKVADALCLFDVIETVDREKIAKRLAEETKKQSKPCRMLVQVNTGEERQKSGVSPQEAVAFVRYCQNDLKLAIEGLMCIPPLGDVAAPHFALLRKLANEAGLCKLSMGMSHDFDTAIMLGATHVRVGTAIFGDRQKP